MDSNPIGERSIRSTPAKEVTMKIVMCVLTIMLLTGSICYGKSMVQCQGILADKPTKDGFGRITLTCSDDIVINKGKPLFMYAKESLIVFDQSKVEWPGKGVKTLKAGDYKKK